MKAAIAALCVGVAWGIAAPRAIAADATHPYSNVNHQNDAGNDTGDSQTDRLNAQELQKVAPPGTAQGRAGQHGAGWYDRGGRAGGYGMAAAPNAPPFGYGYAPPYAYGPPYGYAPPYAYVRPYYGWRPWWGWGWRRRWWGPGVVVVP